MPHPDMSLLLWEQRRQEERRDRLDSYRRNWEYYNGRHNLPLPTRTGQPDDNVILNLPKLIVDKSASYLFGKSVGFELAEGETTPEEQYLADVWAANRKMTFLLKYAKSGGLYGHGFIKIVPDGVRPGVPRLVALEPEIVTVDWDEQDIDRVTRYRIEWVAAGDDGRPRYYRQDITRDGERWQVENQRAQGQGSYGPDPDNPDLVWPYSWPPIIDNQNLPLPGAYYGQSDLEEIRTQDAINYVASNIQRILRYHAHPKTVAAGVGSGDLRAGADDVTLLPSPDAWIKNLEMASDLGSSLAFLERLTLWLLRVTRTPNLDPTQVSVGALSGFALKILYGDALEKTNEKRLTYGDMLVELNRRLLELGGYGPDLWTTLHWQDPLPEDAAAERQRDEFELTNGVASLETVRARRGLDNEVEETRIAAEQAARSAREGNVGALLVQDFFTNRRPEEGGR